MSGTPPSPPRWGPFSISRSLEALAVVALLLIAAGTTHRLLASRALIIADTEQQMSRLDMVFAEQTGRAVEGVDLILMNAIETLQGLRARPPVDAAAYDALLSRRVRGVRQISEVAIIDARGQVLYSSRGSAAPPLPPAGRALVAGLAASPHPGLTFGKPFREADASWTALMLRPVHPTGAPFEGVAVAYLNLAYFEDFYRAVELNDSGAILLHLRDGTVLARYPHADAVVGESFADLPPFKDILAHGLAGTVVMDSPMDGRSRVLAIRALKAFPLAVNVSVAQDRVLSAWRRQAAVFSAIALVASVVIVTLLLLLAQRSRQVDRVLGEYRLAKEAAEEAHHRLTEQMAERERAEKALGQAQRIEAIGQMTGGVAHDFNNLLTVLIGNIDLIRRSSGIDRATVDRLSTMRAAAERGAMLTGRLLAFARRQPLSPRAVDLNDAIAGMEGLLQSALAPRMQIETRLFPDLWPAMVDPTQFELVVLNLVINARDAMPEGGVITLETANTRRQPPLDAEEPPEGDYVVVTVRDTGIGMAPEVQARAFEPFFTTKAPGVGSGLGLSQVFGTARQSGGGVQICSVPGKGTAVSVYLPRATGKPLVAPMRAENDFAAKTGGAVVLAVDDDVGVLATTSEMLRDLGYAVIQATSGEGALELLDQGSVVDVLLSDVVMGGMSGLDLARKVRNSHPQLPVVFISGYAAFSGIAGDNGRQRLVQKPFTATELQRQIEEAIAEIRAATPA